MPVVPALGRQRQKDYKLKADLDYKGRQKKEKEDVRRNKGRINKE